MRISASYSFKGNNENILELPLTTDLLQGIEQAKILSNEFLTRVYEASAESEPIKKKKADSDAEENID
ncbi:hypothetical protein SteCoe_28431 [Stentor coeruleus]|uniref:Uncharacterized protein n=1 Tax=Stentor coeruleus TaxID=5963 RepID=A0A1R2B8S1_9CILI|nr:hypothetical protein SteCoe_28431 [Stentor coeruleus]